MAELAILVSRPVQIYMQYVWDSMALWLYATSQQKVFSILSYHHATVHYSTSEVSGFCQVTILAAVPLKVE